MALDGIFQRGALCPGMLQAGNDIWSRDHVWSHSSNLR